MLELDLTLREGGEEEEVSLTMPTALIIYLVPSDDEGPPAGSYHLHGPAAGMAALVTETWPPEAWTTVGPEEGEGCLTTFTAAPDEGEVLHVEDSPGLLVVGLVGDDHSRAQIICAAKSDWHVMALLAHLWIAMVAIHQALPHVALTPGGAWVPAKD